jgi:hypothetical protein
MSTKSLDLDGLLGVNCRNNQKLNHKYSKTEPGKQLGIMAGKFLELAF